MRRLLMMSVPVIVLAVTGGYMLVYLYRWEWHRALVAGVFMLAIEIGIGFAMLLDRLHRIEARLTESERATGGAVRQTLRETAPEPRKPFAWLSEAANRTSVFVPILLGAGVVLSVLAWALERLAGVTAGAGLERALALRLQPITMPVGVLTGRTTAPLPLMPTAARALPGRRTLIIAATFLAGVFVFAEALDRLEDATQNRPDVLAAGSEGEIVLRVKNRQAPAGAEIATASALWGACSNQIGTRYRLLGVERIASGQVELHVRPAIGKYAERRMRGCFEDATTDLIRADVVSIRGG